MQSILSQLFSGTTHCYRLLAMYLFTHKDNKWVSIAFVTVLRLALTSELSSYCAWLWGRATRLLRFSMKCMQRATGDCVETCAQSRDPLAPVSQNLDT